MHPACAAGLDSHSALAVVKHLIKLTNAGHSIACSIHQPRQEIFASFDKILLMSEGRQVRSKPSAGMQDCHRLAHAACLQVTSKHRLLPRSDCSHGSLSRSLAALQSAHMTFEPASARL